MKFSLSTIFFCFLSLVSFSQSKYDLIIVGGGASGTAAGISAGRAGNQVLIIEPTVWLGGMLTSAGVSAIDGNHHLPSGIWGEFKSNLENHYGGADKLSTGWVSNTLFEPKVGNEILKRMAALSQGLTISYESQWTSAKYTSGQWTVTYTVKGEVKTVTAPLLIDATELGDVAASQGLSYRLGMDARDEIGESFAPAESNDIIQDLTLVATLKDFGPDADRTIEQPEGYDPELFACACAHADPITDADPTLDCDKMLNYGKLPNGKYMINWPNCGNDYYVNLVELSPEERKTEIEKAKLKTLQFVYYIQHELGYKNLGLADDEYPTEDDLPMIPYHRESRRYYGLVDFTLPYVRTPYQAPHPLYRTGVAVGDYTIDHHHKERPDAPNIDFIKIRVPSYNVPLGALIPKDHPGLILAEKSISVSNIVNGASRLQPVVLGIGHAAGALATVALREGKSPADVSIRAVQQVLLSQNGYIMPFIDVNPDMQSFGAIQRIGATGIFKGEGVPYLWANQTWFYPGRAVTEFELIQGMKPLYPDLESFWGASGDYLTLSRFEELLRLLNPELNREKVSITWDKLGMKGQLFDGLILNREQAAMLLDDLLNPFAIEIDWHGELVQ
ncbi:FAD-dependent oxidoreductase [Algoriphagus namhaensis]